MTPFGVKLRTLRARRGVTQKQMAAALGVSPAYLSALEHGKRGVPAWPMLQKIIGYFNIIWDEADQLEYLARLSNPRIMIDTGRVSPAAVELINLLASRIGELDGDTISRLKRILDEETADTPR